MILFQPIDSDQARLAIYAFLVLGKGGVRHGSIWAIALRMPRRRLPMHAVESS